MRSIRDQSGPGGSILSIGSAGSILSIGSAGSILSVGSAGSILSVGSAGSLLSVGFQLSSGITFKNTTAASAESGKPPSAASAAGLMSSAIASFPHRACSS